MNQKLRDEMLIIYGMLQAISFPLIIGDPTNHAYYDLIDSILLRYTTILKQLFGDFVE